MHGLWVLERTGALDDATLATAAKDKEFGVRVHAQRILAERAKWTPTTCTPGLGGSEGRRRRTCSERPPTRSAVIPPATTCVRCSICVTPSRPRTRTCCTSSAWPCAINFRPAPDWAAIPLKDS